MVRFPVFILAMAGLLSPACATDPRTEQEWAARAVRQTPALAGCDLVQQLLALDRIEPWAADVAAYDAAVAPHHARVRGPGRPLETPAGAEIVLTMFAPDDPHQQERTETSSIVWKDRSGWHFDVVDYRTVYSPSPRLPGETPYTHEEYEDLKRSASRGRLDPEQVAEIEAALADPCLALQPRGVPWQVPLVDGRIMPGCIGGFSGGTVAITRGGRTELYSDPCARWAAGRIMRVVMYARPQG